MIPYAYWLEITNLPHSITQFFSLGSSSCKQFVFGRCSATSSCVVVCHLAPNLRSDFFSTFPPKSALICSQNYRNMAGRCFACNKYARYIFTCSQHCMRKGSRTAYMVCEWCEPCERCHFCGRGGLVAHPGNEDSDYSTSLGYSSSFSADTASQADMASYAPTSIDELLAWMKETDSDACTLQDADYPKCYLEGTQFIREDLTFVNVEELKAGDFVADEIGRPTRVEQIDAYPCLDIDFVWLVTDHVRIPLTPDHRVVVPHGDATQTCPAGALTVEGRVMCLSGIRRLRSVSRGPLLDGPTIYKVKFEPDSAIPTYWDGMDGLLTKGFKAPRNRILPGRRRN